MCRLYSFRSTSTRKVECELIQSQNSLLAQSELDEHGNANPDGWGLGTYDSETPCVVRQTESASESEAFRWEAARIHTKNVIAHVRRATVGRVSMRNTHPFSHGNWLLAHNGTVGAFDEVRPRLLEEMTSEHRYAIGGDTDSEHVFHYLLSLRERNSSLSLSAVVARGVHQITEWVESADPDDETALNIVLTDGRESVAVRFGRSLWYTDRERIHPCNVCGGALHSETPHVFPYRAISVASERLTEDEEWLEVPEASLLYVTAALDVERVAL